MDIKALQDAMDVMKKLAEKRDKALKEIARLFDADNLSMDDIVHETKNILSENGYE